MPMLADAVNALMIAGSGVTTVSTKAAPPVPAALVALTVIGYVPA